MSGCARIVWAVSGQGRALQAILAAADCGLLPVQIVAVVTDRRSLIEAVAQARDLPCHRLEPNGDRYHAKLVDVLATHRSEWLGLTFNRLLSDDVIAHQGGRIFNLHMSLLPMFPGFGALRRTLDTGMRLAGATVHLVDANPDKGTILAQAACAVTASDTREALGRRLFGVALPLLIQVVRCIGTRELAYDRECGLRWPRVHVAPQEPVHTFPAIDPDLASFAKTFCATLPG